MPRKLRLPVSILACLLAPALSGVVVGGAWMAVSAAFGLYRPGALAGAANDIFQLVRYAVVFGTVPMLVVGLPAQAWLARRGLTGLLWHAVPAAVAGALILGVLFALWGILVGGIFGGVAGAIAWLIRRPDRDRHHDAMAGSAPTA
jgi:hypothetical protein